MRNGDLDRDLSHPACSASFVLSMSASSFVLSHILFAMMQTDATHFKQVSRAATDPPGGPDFFLEPCSPADRYGMPLVVLFDDDDGDDDGVIV